MQQKTVGLLIILWVQVVVCARILLFTVPVLINKYARQVVPAEPVADAFMVFITTFSFLYLGVGIASLIRRKVVRTFQYAGCALTAFLTAAFFIAAGQSSGPFLAYYFLPLIFSVFAAIAATKSHSGAV